MKKEDIEFLKNLQTEMLTQDTVCQAHPRFWAVAQDEYEICSEDYQDKYSYCDSEECIEYDSFEEMVEDLMDNEHINDKITSYEELSYTLQERFKQLPMSLKESVIQKNTLFLTKKSCENHIKANTHHYNDTVHSFAMTALRSPQVEKLFDIIMNTDFSSLKGDDNDNSGNV